MNAETPVVPKPDMAQGNETSPVETNEPEKVVAVDTVSEFGEKPVSRERTWSEEIEIAGSQLVEKFKELVAEGNVRRLILRTPDDSLLIEIPLLAGAVVGGVVTLFALPLAVLGAIASVLAHVKVEIVRVEPEEHAE